MIDEIDWLPCQHGLHECAECEAGMVQYVSDLRVDDRQLSSGWDANGSPVVEYPR